VIEALFTHETLFFRDPGSYDLMRGTVIPELMAERAHNRKLRIWSAACSSGQEAYSIAMLLLEMGLQDWNIQIVGTDLSSRILERAQRGRFLQTEVNRGLPARLLVKYFQREGLDWQIRDEVRRMTRFSALDLRQTPYPGGPYDVVLCRNVLIYFDLETRRSILRGIGHVLQPKGFLLLGASETTFNLDDSYRRRVQGHSIIYQAPE
jgi:chemotaxis protein methyltransferase CheR